MNRFPTWLDAARIDPFPPADKALSQPNGLLAIGGDLSIERLLLAYRSGIFPWFSDGEPILWWSPDPRMVFRTDAIHVPSRLARSLRQWDWTIRADSAFRDVMRGCAEPRPGQPTTWITDAMLDAYAALHDAGHAHSVEVFDGDVLIGGIYGVAIGRMFFGESMFGRVSGASKVALLALAQGLSQWGWPLIDAQVQSDHLQTLGALSLPRRQFVAEIGHLTAGTGFAGRWTDRFPVIDVAALAD